MLRLAQPLRTGLAVVALGLGACQRTPETSGLFPQDIYVWQRAWTPGVRAALVRGSDAAQSLVIFTAQISPTNAKNGVVRAPIDYAAVKKTGRPIGLAIRIEPYSGPFEASDQTTSAIVELARERIANARANGVEPVELQVDFDCAESKLGGYRVWLESLRKAVAPLPVCPTVLPSWLKRPEFKSLARDCGCYVLQVHCVAPPRDITDTRLLTDPKRTSEWVALAGKIGVPFRVALPTYCYLVAFDAEGKPRGVSAEGPSSRWPADARVVRWEADPGDLAGLISQWTSKRPAAMRGVIWFRMPVDGDVLNWRWKTLTAVMEGRVPSSSVRLEATGAQPSEIILANEGERDEPLPDLIEAAWEGPRLIAADALEGYDLEQSTIGSANHVFFRRRDRADLSRLPPSSRRPIGWIRCESEPNIRLAIVAPAPRAGFDHSVPKPAIDAGDRH